MEKENQVVAKHLIIRNSSARPCPNTWHSSIQSDYKFRITLHVSFKVSFSAVLKYRVSQKALLRFMLKVKSSECFFLGHPVAGRGGGIIPMKGRLTELICC